MPIKEVLGYWFQEIKEEAVYYRARQKLWFGKDQATDDYLRTHFGQELETAGRGECDSWAASPRGRLALIVLLDQFSRNIYRETARMFTQDPKALTLCREGLDNNIDRLLHPVERVFFYLPLEHSEDLEVQHLSIQCFERLLTDGPAPLKESFTEHLDYALRHFEIIQRFGRFPHRNKILGRKTTLEEEEFLKEPRSAF